MKSLCLQMSGCCFAGYCAALLLLAGCSPPPDATGPTSAPPTAPASPLAHPTEGPHHGRLIELGDEEYHAELVHDSAAGEIAIYLLDATGKVSLPVEASEVQVNVSHEGQAQQFSLSARPDESDPDGQSSRFVSDSSQLAQVLDREEVKAQLVVTIEGKQYRGAIQHDHQDHDHQDHEH